MSETPPRSQAVVVGTRGSALARAQAARVVELLEAAWPQLRCEVKTLVTQGDRSQANGRPLPEIGGKGLFTAELEQALRDGGVDLAVHSLKDLPTEDAPELRVGAVCAREDVRDCLVARDGRSLAELDPGARVGTSSLRRAAQLRGMRHDLVVGSIRGNVDTRIRKVREGELDAAVLAAAGIGRLGLGDEVSEWFSPVAMVPAPGQGALAVQCRAGDDDVLTRLAAVDDPEARATTTAERAFLRGLEAGCTAPVGAFARVLAGDPASRSAGVHLHGLVASVDGSDVVRVEGEGQPEEIGERLAQEALAAGAKKILEVIRG